MKRLFIVLPLLMAFLQPAAAEIVNGIACKVGNSVITINEFNKAFQRDKNQAFITGFPAPTKRNVMERLVEEILLRSEAEKRRIVVTEEELDGVIKDLKTQNRLNDEQFIAELAREGITPDELKERYRNEILKTRLINQMADEKRTTVTEEEMQSFYEDPRNSMLFTRPAIVKLSQIFIPVPADAAYKQMLETKNKVQKVYERAKSGESFAGLVREFSMSPDKDKNLGVLGSFTREQLGATMRPDDVDSIFSMESGGVAPPIRFSEGYYIFRADDIIPEESLSYEDARENIRSYVLRRKGDDQFVAWLSGRKKSTNIQYMVGLE